MGSCEGSSAISAPKPQSNEPELGLGSSDSQTYRTHSTLESRNASEEEALVQKFENVGLQSNQSKVIDNDHKGRANVNASISYPLRPYAEDCAFYLKTGTCKFGQCCKFNHPVGRTNKVAKEKEKGGVSENSEQAECKGLFLEKLPRTRTAPRVQSPHSVQIKYNGHKIRIGSAFKKFKMTYGFELNSQVWRKLQCKEYQNVDMHETLGLCHRYYLTDVGCKFGKLCKFNHLRDWSKVVLPELNFLGLPIRSGEKECPFYMHTGSCGYGAHCKFHHPDPIIEKVSDTYKSINNKSVGKHDRSSGKHNGKSPLLLSSGSSQPAQVLLSWHMISNPVPYHHNYSFYVPATHALLPGVHRNLEWMYQAPNSLEEKTGHNHLAPAINNLVGKANISAQVEEFPERLDQPKCKYYVKTGDSKFESACRYHHPKSQAPKVDACVLSEKGLPLRPGRKICQYFGLYGICKYGRACLFDHQLKKHCTSTSQVAKLESPSSSNSGTKMTRMTGNEGGNEIIVQQLA